MRCSDIRNRDSQLLPTGERSEKRQDAKKAKTAKKANAKRHKAAKRNSTPPATRSLCHSRILTNPEDQGRRPRPPE